MSHSAPAAPKHTPSSATEKKQTITKDNSQLIADDKANTINYNQCENIETRQVESDRALVLFSQTDIASKPDVSSKPDITEEHNEVNEADDNMNNNNELDNGNFVNANGRITIRDSLSKISTADSKTGNKLIHRSSNDKLLNGNKDDRCSHVTQGRSSIYSRHNNVKETVVPIKSIRPNAAGGRGKIDTGRKHFRERSKDRLPEIKFASYKPNDYSQAHVDKDSGSTKSQLTPSEHHRALMAHANREKTFEITPAGFDVRYQDITLQTNTDQPEPIPEDVRAKAIAKVKEWLNKHCTI